MINFVHALILLWSGLSPTAAGPGTPPRRRPHISSPATAETHRLILEASRRLPDMSPVSTYAAGHLVNLCTGAKGDSNPRVTCTGGNALATDYIVEQMGEIGLKPAGDSGLYTQTVGGSVNETFCPAGMRNVIGYVEGTVRPDEFVVYSAHLDGPNNNNPQTDATRGNTETCNAYDNGLAVAVGLGMAQVIAEDPPEVSVLFLFDDGEEGWINVLTPKLGETWEDVCDSFKDTDWYQDIYFDLGTNQYGAEYCPWQTIGASYWTKYPTVDLSKIRVMYVIDPLGSPYNATMQALAAIGGERVSYDNGAGGTLNDYLDLVFPNSSSVKLAKMPQAAVAEFGSSAYAVTGQWYLDVCGDSCLLSGGLPAVWLAQPSFQKYHGGSAIGVAKDLFGAAMGGEGAFPTPTYFSVDDLEAFYLPNLDAVATALTELVINSASASVMGDLAYDKDKSMDLDARDMQNVIGTLDMLSVLVGELPEPTASTFKEKIATAKQQAQGLLQADLTIPAVQVGARQIAQLTFGIGVAYDFFNDDYPGKEAFLDQRFGPPPNEIESEPRPTDTPSLDPSSMPSAMLTTDTPAPTATADSVEKIGVGFVHVMFCITAFLLPWITYF